MGSQIIPLDHTIFQMEAAVKAASSDFFNAHGISYFQYHRTYADTSLTALLSDMQVMRHFIELDWMSFSSYEEMHHKRHSYWFFWDEELPWLPISSQEKTIISIMG